jgi:hypothetical protein
MVVRMRYKGRLRLEHVLRRKWGGQVERRQSEREEQDCGMRVLMP